ncbi:hypothetical protein WDV06_23835 [Streptomyces racemochromogenes]|uniref:Uncharacterized protein n=1 Tax=Streptomyces racemochromogenes TaxID=67353 RepID=A0ABW7PI78_9ACTN
MGSTADTGLFGLGVRGTVGLGLFGLGTLGILVGSRCERGWEHWNRTQRIICSVSGAVAFAGLIVMG